MTTKTMKRVQAAKFGAKFAGVLSRDKRGIRSMLVPGSDGKQYQVIIQRLPGEFRTQCLLQTGVGTVPCKGNSIAVCYHSIMAAQAAATDAGYSISVCDTKEDAEAVKKLHSGSSVCKLFSRQSGKSLWLVYFSSGGAK